MFIDVKSGEPYQLQVVALGAVRGAGVQRSWAAIDSECRLRALVSSHVTLLSAWPPPPSLMIPPCLAHRADHPPHACSLYEMLEVNLSQFDLDVQISSRDLIWFRKRTVSDLILSFMYLRQCRSSGLDEEGFHLRQMVIGGNSPTVILYWSTATLS